MKSINWNYCKDPNTINEAIKEAIWNKSSDWDGITADNIISITWDSNQGCYVVFWRYGDDN